MPTELIEIDYEPLPVVTDPRLGERDGTALVHDTCPNNYLIKREFERGNVDEAFRNAHLVVKRKFKIGRKQALCLEGRGCVAGYRESTFGLTLLDQPPATLCRASLSRQSSAPGGERHSRRGPAYRGWLRPKGLDLS